MESEIKRAVSLPSYIIPPTVLNKYLWHYYGMNAVKIERKSCTYCYYKK